MHYVILNKQLFKKIKTYTLHQTVLNINNIDKKSNIQIIKI